jgi:uncharacterized protein YdaU (DUF1376 family)
MHYYKFNIADWHLATSHLSLEEEAVYFKLINYYYDSERCIPKETDSVIRRLRLGSVRDIVGIVLKEFFVLQDDGWHHLRCDDEILKYHHKAEVNQRIGKLGGRPKKTQTVSVGIPEITLTTNHKPLTSIDAAKATKGTRFNLDAIPEDWILFCKKERSDLNPTVVFDGFKDYWSSVAGQKGVKLDWSATWRNWIRNQKAGISVIKQKQAWE